MTYDSNSIKDFRDEFARVKERTEASDFKKQIDRFDRSGIGYTSVSDFIKFGIVGPYKIGRTLGTGSFSRVQIGIKKDEDQSVAIKIISRYNDVTTKESYFRKEERVFREALISSLTNHPNIVKLLDFFYNEYFYFMIFESVEGEQLLDIITKKGALEEKRARKYYTQILSAVNYLHLNSIVHRDLKIENILVDERDNIKIIDFGLSNFYDNKQLLNTFCGSLYFAAPELLTGTEYCGPEVDVWALGVVLFVLVCGKVPFDDKDLKTLHKKIKAAELNFNKDLSVPLQSLLDQIIVNDPRDRMSMDEILNHEWVTRNGKKKIPKIGQDRKPITEVNETYLNYLYGVLKHQFPDFKSEMLTYVQICAEGGSEERLFWTRIPSVSMYYMLMDNFDIHDSDVFVLDKERDENMSRFVKYLFSENSHYTRRILRRQCKKNNHTHASLRKKVITFFKKQNISYETQEKNYVCTMRVNDRHIKFHISLFCNLKLEKHFLTIKKIYGKNEDFRDVTIFVKELLVDL